MGDGILPYPRYRHPSLEYDRFLSLSFQKLTEIRQIVRNYYVSTKGQLSLDPRHSDTIGSVNTHGFPPYDPVSTDIFEIPVVFHNLTYDQSLHLSPTDITKLLEQLNKIFANTIHLDPFSPRMPDIRFPSRTPEKGQKLLVLSLARQSYLAEPNDFLQVTDTQGKRYIAFRISKVLFDNLNTQNPFFVIHRPFYNNEAESLVLQIKDTEWSARYIGITGGSPGTPEDLFREGILQNIAPDLSPSYAQLDLQQHWGILEVRHSDGRYVSSEDFTEKLDSLQKMYFERDNTHTRTNVPLSYLDFNHRVGQMNIRFSLKQNSPAVDLTPFYASDRNLVELNGSYYYVLARQESQTMDFLTPHPRIVSQEGVYNYGLVLRPVESPNSPTGDIRLEGQKGTPLSLHTYLVDNYYRTMKEESTERSLFDFLKISNTLNIFLVNGTDMGRRRNWASLTSPPVEILSRSIGGLSSRAAAGRHHGIIFLDEEATLEAVENVRGDRGQCAAHLVHAVGSFLGLLPTFGLVDASDNTAISTDLILDTPLSRTFSSTSLDPLSPNYLQVLPVETVASVAGGMVTPMFMNFMDWGPTPNSFTHGQVFVARYFLTQKLSQYISDIGQPDVQDYTNSSGRVIMPIQWHKIEKVQYAKPSIRNIRYDNLVLDYSLEVPEAQVRYLQTDVLSASSAYFTQLDVTHLRVGGTPLGQYLEEYLPSAVGGGSTTSGISQTLDDLLQENATIVDKLDLIELEQSSLRNISTSVLTDITDLVDWKAEHVQKGLLFVDASEEAIREATREALLRDASSSIGIMKSTTYFPQRIIVYTSPSNRWTIECSDKDFKILNNEECVFELRKD